jgi:4-amino-4-deoxy-L-arabinose transferase-like glycosyltransferase
MSEREWREASDMRRSTATLAAILVVAAVLRFWSLDAGIPYAIGDDEPQVMNRAVTMVRSGDFNPRFYDYPGLYLYVQSAVVVVRFLAGATAGRWTSLDKAHTPDFYLWGRAVTAALGTATVALVFFIGTRWGTRHALLAAGLLAVMPLHVRESHFVLTDVPVTFFVTLAFLLTLRAHEQPQARMWGWAGVAAGLAAATKYPGALALVLPLIAVWMSPSARPSRLTGALAAIAGAGAAYLLAAPYTVLDLPGFLNGYAHLMTSYTGVPPVEAPAVTYLKHLRRALWWPGFIAVIGGVAFAVVRAIRGPGRVRWTLAVLFPVLFFWFVSRQTLVFARYLLPLVPFACVLAATAIVSGVSLLRRFSIPRLPRTALITALTILVLLPPALTAVSANRMLGSQTAANAYAWIRANVPEGSKIVVESNRLTLAGTPYASRNVPQLRLKSYDDYVEDGVDYLVASSQCYGPYFAEPHRFRREYEEYMRLFTQAREVARFTPPPGKPWPELIILRVKP